MELDLRVFDIPRDRWRTAWALHATRTADGAVHLDIAAFAESVGVPTDEKALAVLAALVHRYLELLAGGAVPLEFVQGSSGPPTTRH